MFALATRGANRSFAVAILLLGFLTGAKPGEVQIFIQRLRPITYARPDMMHALRRLWTKLPQGPAWSLPALLRHNDWSDRLHRLLDEALSNSFVKSFASHDFLSSD